MADYLGEYGIEETRRHRIVKRVVLIAVAAVIVAVAAYLFLKNYPEKKAINNFLSQVNTGQLQTAYNTWGCTADHPCRDYSYQKFSDDWGISATGKFPKWTGVPQELLLQFGRMAPRLSRCGWNVATRRSVSRRGPSARASNGGLSSSLTGCLANNC